MFDERQLDALKELCNIASGSAATVLSPFLRQDIRIEVPRVVPGEDAVRFLEATESWASIQHAVGGKVGGRLVVLVRSADLGQVLEPLLGRPVARWHEDEAACSAVREISNILTSYFLSVMGQFFGQVLVPGVPELSVTVDPALLNQVHENEAILIETRFHNRGNETLWYLLLLPERGSMHTALDQLLRKA